ncbi:MAG TPA: aliphatic sulfonate ABC transporter substrate-binding protein [Bacillota bacterium]|nr:aliphatic sulfonate ABC transporter substrate-binding protein [Peptococcaceae bacterium MAG4]HPZ44260.1 aliphatic sulfonate ABC transporter substrate-binding protein [Bacillota bacterium]
MRNSGNCRLVIAILVVAALLVMLAGCGQKAEDGQDKVLKVGYFPNLTHAQALVGLNDGTFQKALGDEIEIKEYTFNAGPSEIEALLAGEIDIGYIGPVPAINGFVKSRGELSIIAGASDAGAVLVARPGAGIKSVKDLDGKRVAIPQLGNTQDISLRYLLTQVNLMDSSKGGTVNIIPVANPDILTLLVKGELDAALVPEPWGSIIIKQAGAEIVLDAGEVWRDGKYTTAVVIASNKVLRERPELVKKWLEAHVDLTERINRDKEGGKAAINNQIEKLTRERIPDDVLDSAFERLVITYDPETESIEEFAKLSCDYGYLKEQPDLSNLVNTELLNQVLQAKGLPPVQ